MLSADQFKNLAGAARTFLEVELPDGHGRVRLRSWSEKELSHYQSTLHRRAKKHGDGIDIASRTAIGMSLVDEHGQPLLAEKDWALIDEMPSRVTSFLFSAVARFVGLERSEIEDLVKNSERTAAASSS